MHKLHKSNLNLFKIKYEIKFKYLFKFKKKYNMVLFYSK